MSKPSFNEGMWWAIETCFSSYEEGSAEMLLKESNIQRDEAIKLAKESGFMYPKIINYFDVFVWNLKDIEALDNPILLSQREN